LHFRESFIVRIFRGCKIRWAMPGWSLQTVSSTACRSKPRCGYFDDPLHASRPDLHPDGDRWHTVGLVGPVLLLVVHTWPDVEGGEPVGRIISARKATAHERKAYEKGSF
jgi:uncharacterized DUF497 family protein